MISERETEITHVVKSIQDLNELFKDLAVMIEDQGTVVDRIDYNIEKVSYSVLPFVHFFLCIAIKFCEIFLSYH